MTADDAKHVLQQHLDWANGKNRPGIGRAELNAAIDAAGIALSTSVDHIKQVLHAEGFRDPFLLMQIRFLVCDM